MDGRGGNHYSAKDVPIKQRKHYQLAEDKKTQSEKFDMFEKSIDSMLNAMETAELEGYKPKKVGTPCLLPCTVN